MRPPFLSNVEYYICNDDLNKWKYIGINIDL